VALTKIRGRVTLLAMFVPTLMPMAMPMRSDARGAAVVCPG
jgi:hypothetical protein